MELQQLRYFLAVAEAGGVSRVAEQAYVSQPAVSHAISSLEKELGVLLFDRRNRRMQLTRSGRLFQQQVQDAISSLDAGVQMIHHLQQADENTIRLCLRGGHIVMLSRIAAYKATQPNVRFDLVMDEDCVADTALDLIAEIRFSPVANETARPVERIELVAVLPRDLPIAAQPFVCPEQLASLPYYQFQELQRHEQSGLQAPIDDLHCQAIDLQPGIVVSCSRDNVKNARLAMQLSGGFTIWPKLGLSNILDAELTSVPIGADGLFEYVFLSIPHEHLISSAARAFFEAVTRA